jgi:nicotinamidase-related amidase
MRILKENSLYLIIDVQDRLLPHIYNNQELEKNLAILTNGMKILGIPLILTEQYPKGLGPTVSLLKSMVNPVEPIVKTAFSCCDEPAFMNSLVDHQKKNVIIAGIESHVCVLQTVLDLLEKGFRSVVVEDCISSRKLNDKKVAVRRMREAGAIITTYESILLELTRLSGTGQFKEISKLVK